MDAFAKFLTEFRKVGRFKSKQYRCIKIYPRKSSMGANIQTVALVHEHDILIKRSTKEPDVKATRDKIFIVIFQLTLPNA